MPIDYVWSGWGYLSENFNLPKTLFLENIGFIGPSEESMKLLGDKHLANDFCIKLNIPCVRSINLSREIVDKEDKIEEESEKNLIKNFFFI